MYHFSKRFLSLGMKILQKLFCYLAKLLFSWKLNLEAMKTFFFIPEEQILLFILFWSLSSHKEIDISSFYNLVPLWFSFVSKKEKM